MVYPAQPCDVEWAEKIPTLLKANLPWLSKGARRKVFREFVDSLSDMTFNVYSTKIMDKIGLTEKKSREFKDSDAELKDILVWLRRLEPYKAELLKRIRENRKKYKLAI